MWEDNTNQEIFYNQNYQKFILIYIKLYKKEWKKCFSCKIVHILFLQSFFYIYFVSSSNLFCSSSDVFEAIGALNACIKCTSLLHPKSMVIDWHVLYFNKKVTSFMIVGLYQHNMPFDKPSHPNCELHLFFIGLWQILKECLR